jgi:hypothetical protein
MFRLRAASTTQLYSRSMAGCVGSQVGHGADIAAGGGRGAWSFSRSREFGVELVGRDRRRGTSIMIRASAAAGMLAACKAATSASACFAQQLARLRHHRQHDLDIAMHRGAGRSAQLRAKISGRASEPESAHTEEQVASPAGVNPGMGLSPPASACEWSLAAP